MKELRTKNYEVYSILNKLKNSSMNKNLIPTTMYKKIKKFINEKNDKIYINNNLKVYHMKKV